jgi:hypothetical protein
MTISIKRTKSVVRNNIQVVKVTTFVFRKAIFGESGGGLNDVLHEAFLANTILIKASIYQVTARVRMRVKLRNDQKQFQIILKLL